MIGNRDNFSSADGAVEQLVRACLEEADRTTRHLIDRACRDHPREAQALRNQYEALRASGLLGLTSGSRHVERGPAPWDTVARDVVSDPEAARRYEAVGPYQPLKELGQGGQAVVYLAEDVRLHRPVALKILKGLGPLSETLINRFRREAEVASRLDHPGICAVYDAGVRNRVPYIAMRFVNGTTLADRIDAASKARKEARRPSPPVVMPNGEASSAAPNGASISVGSVARKEIHRVLAVIEKAARALHVAHEAGIVHRDVKPGNIMVTPAGEPVLLDFGLAGDEEGALASLTETGDPVGTLAYMSPEQLMAKQIRVDRRTDVFSLGVTLFECLTLVRPFQARTREGVARSIRLDEPRDIRKLNPSLSQDVKIVVETALEKDRDKRYQTAEDLAEDIRRIRENEPIAARPVSAGGRLWRWAKRRPMRAALLVVLIGGLPLVAALVGYVTAHLPAIVEAERQAFLERVERHLEDGFHQLATREPEAAILSFQAALALEPDGGEAVAGQALAHFRAKQYQVCLDFLERYRSLENTLPALTEIRADALLELGRRGEADDLLQKRPEPRTALGFFLEGARLVKGTDIREDQEDQAVDRRPLDCCIRATLLAGRPRALYHFQLAIAAGRLGEDGPAPRVARALRVLWPTSPRANFHAGYALTKVNDEESIAAYRRAIALKSDFAAAYCNLGVRLERRGELDAALVAGRKAIALRPENATFHQNLGAILIKKGDFDAAIAAYTRAIDLRPENTCAYHGRGIALGKAGRLEEALADYRKAIALDPGYARAHNSLGALLCDKMADYDGAIAAFKETIRLEPNYAEAHRDWGNALRKARRFDEAAEAYRRTIELDPHHPHARGLLGLALFEGNRLGEAVDACNEAIAREPSNATHYLNLGRALHHLGRLAEAADAYEKALERRREFPAAWFNLGQVFVLQSRWDEAIAAYEKAIEQRPDYAKAHARLGAVRSEKGQFRVAIEPLRRAIVLEPAHAGHYLELGVAYSRVGQTTEAIKALRRSIALKDDNALAWSNLGLALRRVRKLDEAISAHEEAIKRRPDWAKAYVRLGALLCDEMGDYDRAIAAFKEAIRLRPDDVAAHCNLGVALDSVGRLEEAIAEFRKAVELEPGLAHAHCSLATALYRDGQLDEAIARYNKALTLKPDFGLAHLNLGEAMQAKGDFGEAIRCFERALRHKTRWVVEVGARPRLWRTRQMLRAKPRYARVLHGAEPGEAGEAAAFARIAYYQQRYRSSAGLWRFALHRNGLPPRDRRHDRWDAAFCAACSAALAGTGKGKDAGESGDAERAEWRRQAVAWLDEALVAWRERLADGKIDKRVLAWWLRNCKTAPDLAGIRDETYTAKLPDAERLAFRNLWTALSELLAQATK